MPVKNNPDIASIALYSFKTAVKIYAFFPVFLLSVLALFYPLDFLSGIDAPPPSNIYFEAELWKIFSHYFEPFTAPPISVLYSINPMPLVHGDASALSLQAFMYVAFRFLVAWLCIFLCITFYSLVRNLQRPRPAPRPSVDNVLWATLALEIILLTAGLLTWITNGSFATKISAASFLEYQPYILGSPEMSWHAKWVFGLISAWNFAFVWCLGFRWFSWFVDHRLFGGKTLSVNADNTPKRDPVQKAKPPRPARKAPSPADRCPAVVGQPDAKISVWELLDSVAAGVKPSPRRPHAVFLFMGPSGVGKTEMAKEIAREFYGSRKAMVRLNMQEYGDKNFEWGLLGPARGYVGSDKGGVLTQALKARPESVLLLDEMEKGHPKLMEMFMTAFDEGSLQDKSTGEFVTLSRSIVVMTSNLLADRWEEMTELGQSDLKGFIQTHGGFKPEFLGRIDQVVVFHPLDDDAVETITRRRLAKALQNFPAMGWNIFHGDDLMKYVLHHAEANRYGVRSLDQAMASKVTGPLTRLIRETRGIHRRRRPKPLYAWPDPFGRSLVVGDKNDFDRREPWKPPSRHQEVQARKSLLKDRIVGQDVALESIERRVMAAARGLTSKGKRPLLSMLFVGPSGVGKTETARVISEVIFGSPGSMVQIDLGQFSMPGSEYRLFGRNGGQPGLLTGPVSARPRSLVLLDEADKASPGVWDAIMTLLDEGYVTEPDTGVKISFSKTVVILTANPPAQLLDIAPAEHVEEDQLRLLLAQMGMFRQEFLGRMDVVTAFQPLNADALAILVERRLKTLADNVKKQVGSDIEWDTRVVGALAARALGSPFGARKAQSLVDETAAVAVSEFLASAPENEETSHISLIVDGDGKIVTQKEGGPA